MSLPSFNIYDASAGSGKTYTLVKAYLKILFHSPYKDTYKNILAITFTNKAVGEMKERVIETLKQFSGNTILTGPNSMFKDICDELEIAPQTLSKKSKDILENIIHNYAAFDISTIDKFTQKLIRTFAYDLHLPLNFEVELDTDTLLTKAVDNLIARAGTEKELTKTLIDFAIEKADDDKSWDITYDFNLIAKLLVNENHVPYVTLLKDKTLHDFKALKTHLRKELKNVKTHITQEAKNALELIDASGVEHSDFSRSALPNHFKKLANETYGVSFTSNWQNNLVEGSSLYPGRVSKDIASIIDGLQTQLASMFSNTKQLIVHYHFLQNLYNNITPLSVLNEISKEVHKIKEDQNLLLISEFNSIISNHIKAQPAPFIYERIGEKFKHYFIDEFQDTSKMQWENLVPLLENTLSGENGSVMLVGDAKQAIYRWRGGKAEQFIELYNDKHPFHQKVHKEHLPVNYRSYKQIVEFNNAFFKHLSSFVFSNSTYADLYQNSHQDISKNNEDREGYVNISFLELDKEDDKDLAYPTQVLKTIHSCLDNGFGLNDVCVLVRKKKEGVAVAKHLSEHGIDIVSSETLLVGNAPEVKFIINLLKYILEPQNLEVKIEVISYLANDKLQVDDIHVFYKNLMALNVEAFFAQCHDLGFHFNYKEALQIAVYDVIETIIYGFNLTTTSNAYIQFFLDFALDYDTRKNSNLADFINYFETKKETLTIVSPEGQNAVNIMTIHKSKGLEFPVVIFPYADLNIYKENNPKIWFPLDASSFNGFSTAYINYNKNIEAVNDIGEALYTQHQAELELDNINLLYVTLTRPVEQLYIISKTSGKKNEPLNAYNELLIHYLKHANLWEENKLTYSFGGEKRHSIPKKKTTTTEKQESFFSIPKKAQGINIITSSANLWDTSQKEAIERGNLIHDIMSQIKTKNDIELTIDNFISTGTINKDQGRKLKQIIENIVNHPQIAHLFSTDVTVYNEKDIITKQGNILRPDRIVINKENHVTIVDYKTGSPNNSHVKQLKSYNDALRDMAYTIKKGVLIYTNDSIEIKEV